MERIWHCTWSGRTTILIKHGSYCVRVHHCRVKLVHVDRNISKEKTTTETSNITDKPIPCLNIPNEVHSSEEESDLKDFPTPMNSNTPITPTQQTQTQQNSAVKHHPVPKEKLKIKPNLCLKYKDNSGEWQNVRILSRAGKVGGKHDGWFNVETETGMKRAVNFANIKDIEINDSSSEVTLITNNSEVLVVNSQELQSWIDNSMYTLRYPMKVKTP